jgi:hypothetical protein
MAEQDKDSHILSNPLPGEKLPWKTETPADRVDESTVMMNEQPDNAKINGTSAEVSSIGNTTDSDRLQQLITEGHGVQRHGAQVTRDQLIDRAMYGKDPMTGTTVDGVHGGVHQYAQHATKVTSDPAYVHAENYARNSQQFIDATTSSTTGRAQVEIPLKDIFVDDFSGDVFGITREGPKNAPTGYTETIFDQGSSMIVRYKQNSTGDWVFNTMFPQPK